MRNKICCGFGHREVFNNITTEMFERLTELIEEGFNVFYTGGDGEFDRIFASAIRTLKHKYPYIKLCLIKPYFLQSLNTNKEFYSSAYDEIIIPQELMGCHYKGAIQKRNRWLIDRSDAIIFYVRRNFGGAYTALNYAKKQKKRIFLLNNK